MTRFYVLLGLSLCFLSTIRAQTDPEIKFVPADSIYNIINHPPDSTILVINFWATWCRPCIEELPYFKQADSVLKGENYLFIYVSLDAPSDKKAPVKFIKQKKQGGRHYQLNETDLDQFINKIDPNWGGSIPYTIVLSKGDRKNHEGAFENYRQLWQFIRSLGKD